MDAENWLYSKLFLGRCSTHIYSQHTGNLWQNKVWIPPKPNMVNQWFLLVLFMGVWVRGYLQEQQWLKDSCIAKAYPNVHESSQRWEPRGHCPACRQLNKLESVSASFCFFQVAGLVLDIFAAQLVWKSLLCSLVVLVSFRDFLFKELPAGYNVSVLEETVTQQNLNSVPRVFKVTALTHWAISLFLQPFLFVAWALKPRTPHKKVFYH